MRDELSNLWENSVYCSRPNILEFIKVDEPIFYATVYMESIFLSYILQDRTIIKNNKIVEIKEMFAVETSFDTVAELLTQKISVYDSLEKSKKKYKKGKIGNKLFPEKLVENIEEISDKIPEKNYMLDLQSSLVTEYFKIIDTRKKRLHGYDTWGDLDALSETFKISKSIDINIDCDNSKSRGVKNYEIFGENQRNKS